jgi:uncharacterized membrane protein YhdT
MWIIYGIVLIIWWVITQRIKPSQYPNVPAESLLAWRDHKLTLYRRYAGFLVIWLVLAFINGGLLGFAQKHPHTAWVAVAYLSMAVLLIYLIWIFVVIIKNAHRNYRTAQELGIYKR